MSKTTSLFIWMVALTISAHTCVAAPVVDIELAKKTAWTGEGVPFFVTLHSPGPFSGTASFDLPELPQTVFVKVGSPVVGNTTVDGESLFTQRHEFILYTQQSGEFTIPPFRVRFSGKKSFLGDAEPIEADTQQVRFESQRPPGFESLGTIIATTNMTVNQSWLPAAQASEEASEPIKLQAGDVLQRTVTRTASATTAMILPAITTKAPAGIRVYKTNPTIEDNTVRGQSTARRVDTIKYQFERPGTFELSAMNFTWWDSASEELKTDTIDGLLIEVEGQVTTATTSTDAEAPSRRRLSVGITIAICFLAWLALKLVQPLVEAWQSRRNSPAAIATRDVHTACRANDPAAAYSAILDWQRAAQPSHSPTWLTVVQSDTGAEFQYEWQQLAQRLFGQQEFEQTWKGGQFQQTFDSLRKALNHDPVHRTNRPPLPKMNPTT